ncbi:MAG: UDP-N-acetylmuramoyl-L-alanyl-D-glutamate--2,6-diaminopimelate ligase [Clostridia bacterium]|nr:UDP-N-acetylmuramoyl-L-alanyl-D-glutamate--2,6-diaminopimelate ligase [Clostridia bacterium]
MNLSELLKHIEVTSIDGTERMEITGLAFDSRAVKPGNLFVCISGFQTDGHQFAKGAVENGAIAVVAERELEDVGVTCIRVENSRLALAKLAAAFYGNPDQKFCLIGITGTNGKTTTSYLIKSVLEAMGKKVGLIGTNQNMIGTEVIPTHHTTPDSLELMRLFAMMADKGAEYVVMEVSSHSLALDRVAACSFDVGGFTNITQDHLDFHNTMEEYLSAKSILFRYAKAGAVNMDDDAANYLLEHATCDAMLTYGIEEHADMQASQVELKENGVKFNLSYEGKEYDVELGIPGKFSVYNAMTALSCLAAAGISMEDAVRYLKVARGVKGRVEMVETGRDYSVIIDYAHTPDGLLNVISTIRGFAKGRILVVFGCGGDRDRTKRPEMGKIAAELADLAIVTSDNPRSENPDAIIADILEGVKEANGEYVVVPNRFEAIEYALDHAQKDDIVLLAGKGHETYQILADRTISFDEREIVHKLLHNQGESRWSGF